MVNLAPIKLLLSPVSYNIDDDDDPNLQRYSYVEVNNEQLVRRMAREGIIPTLRNFDEEGQRLIVTHLYGLIRRSCRDDFFVELMYNCYLPFPVDKGTRQTFVWIWEEIEGREYTDGSEEPCGDFEDDYSVYRTLKYTQP